MPEMREIFHHYFPPTETEFRSMWQDGIFSFDANVLLNIYRYSEDTSKSLLDFIVSQADRIRLPYQFALEFVRNRPRVIVTQAIKCEAAHGNFERLDRELSPKSEHPHLTDRAREAIELLKTELAANRKKMERLISTDEYASKLNETLSTKIGPEPSEADLTEMHSEAAKRFENAVPPGFADTKDKKPPECYGDYIAWKQLIAIASDEKRDVILVTDDAKDDWWRIESGRTIGPRPELLTEFKKLSGQRIWLYPSDRFLLSAKQYLAAPIDEKVIEEVGARLTQKREEEEAKLAKPAAPEFDPVNEEKLSPSSADKPTADRDEGDL